MRWHLASVAWRAAALPTPRRLVPGSGLELICAFAALALAAKQTLLEIADLGLSPVEFATKCSLALLGLDLRQSHLGAQTQFSLDRVLL